MQPLDPKQQPNPTVLHHQQPPQQERLQREYSRHTATSSAVSRKPRAVTNTRKVAVVWSAAIITVLSWVIVIATHVEWVRQHDGPSIHPMPYFIPLVVSVLAAVFILLFRRPSEPKATMVHTRRASDGYDIAEVKSSPRFDNGDLQAGTINQAGHDINIERENFLREIAATKTKARWLVWTGLLAVVVGFGLFAAGVLGFIKQAGSAVESSGGATSPFGPDIGGVPSGLIGWALAMLGVLLLVVGIVLHIVATSKRGRADRDYPVPRPWSGTSP
jgi:hypothetical protein